MARWIMVDPFANTAKIYSTKDRANMAAVLANIKWDQEELVGGSFAELANSSIAEEGAAGVFMGFDSGDRCHFVQSYPVAEGEYFGSDADIFIYTTVGQPLGTEVKGVIL